jgi:hypothetical protein
MRIYSSFWPSAQSACEELPKIRIAMNKTNDMYTPEGFSARDPSLLSVPMRSVKQWRTFGF